MKATAIILMLLSPSLLAQSLASRGTESGDRKATELLFCFASLPAEYRADLYSSVYQNMQGQVSTETNRRLLKIIFLAGAKVHYAAMPEYAAKSPESSASQSFRNLVNQRLDGVDIQANVVTLALPPSPDYAAEALAQIKLTPSRSTCKNPSVVELDRYYDAAALVLKSDRVTKIGDERKSDYLARSIREIESPAQVAPMLHLITNVSPDPSLLQEYAAAITDKLGKIAATDREMITVLQPMATAMPPYLALLAKSGIGVAKPLQAYRAFLVEGLTGQECADLSANRALAVKSFAALLATHPTPSVSVLNLSDLKPSAKGPAAEDPQIQIDERIFQPLQRLYALKQARVAAAQKSLSAPDEQTDPQDVRAVIEFALSPKTDSSFCPTCRFEGPAFAFFSLINTLPPGQDLARSLDAYIDFLSHNRIEEEDPPAFLVPLKQLINTSRPVSEKGKEAVAQYLKKHRGAAIIVPSEEADFVRKELLRSTDPIIKAYMLLEETFHPTFLVPSENSR